MARYDATTAECLVFTYKEGVLSAIAHDLKHRVTAFTVDVDDRTGAIDARFDARSLRVECVMRAGREAPGSLRDDQKREIEGNVIKDVLHARRHPEIRFVSREVEPQGEGLRVVGTLSLHGVDRRLEAVARRDGERLVASVPIHQPDYGIQPYRALLGALKIQPTLRVQLSIPA